MIKLLCYNFHPYNDRKAFSQSFEAVPQLQAKLHFLKVEELDARIRPFRKSNHIYSVRTLIRQLLSIIAC